MTTGAIEVAIAGTSWQLLAERAAFWPAHRMLVVADVHLGKAATFRARGVPVPRGTTQDNLARLTRLTEATGAATLVFLGDLLHAREALSAATIEALAAWRAGRDDLRVVLVEGNHDAKAGALPAALDIERVAEPWCLDGLAFCHHPRVHSPRGVLAGHLHPVVHLRGRADDSVRLPCFWLRGDAMVLPAFGDFTGGASIARETGDRVLAVADGRLFEIPAQRAA